MRAPTSSSHGPRRAAGTRWCTIHDVTKRTLPIRRVCPKGEKWEDMAVVDGGRQCLRCDAHLLDLSTLTEAQVDLVRQRARLGAGVCAKVSLDSDGLPIYRKAAVRRLVQTAAGVVMSVSLAACGEPEGVTVTPLAPRATEAKVEPEVVAEPEAVRPKPEIDAEPEAAKPEPVVDAESDCVASGADAADQPRERRRVRRRRRGPDGEEFLILGFLD